MNVLVGIGGQTDSLTSLERATKRAAETGDQLTVAILDADCSAADPAELESRINDALSATAVEATIRHVSGDPGSQLVDIAESEGFDEVVLGGGTTSPMGKIRIDKTTEFVLLNSHTTVTLVR